MSEEGGRTPHAERQTWSRMWLVDPLDGTGSFIRLRSGYAINVALIESDGHDWHPILGIVALPDLDRVYFGGCGIGTWKARIDDAARPPRPINADEDVTPPYSLLISWNEPGTLNDLVAGTVDPTQVRMRPASGAAKFCLVAEGKADLHARSTGYFEWDCAAGDALFRSQGLAVCDVLGRPLTYNGPTLRVGGLIASRIRQADPGRLRPNSNALVAPFPAGAVRALVEFLDHVAVVPYRSSSTSPVSSAARRHTPVRRGGGSCGICSPAAGGTSPGSGGAASPSPCERGRTP